MIKDKRVILSEKPEFPENTKAVIIIYPLKSPTKIQKRQLEILKRGFPMGGIKYTERRELNER
uniref:Uncharacterized protein n=1 Tax=candidate division WOR-3 bacterium TaxID=2052148 RepID=A0A7C4TFQ9_UNCW3